jgi:hypothetical protein
VKGSRGFVDPLLDRKQGIGGGIPPVMLPGIHREPDGKAPERSRSKPIVEAIAATACTEASWGTLLDTPLSPQGRTGRGCAVIGCLGHGSPKKPVGWSERLFGWPLNSKRISVAQCHGSPMLCVVETTRPTFFERPDLRL